MNIELWRNVKIVDTSATATKRLIKIIAVSLVTAILLGTTIGHTKTMDKNNEINKYDYVKKKIKNDEDLKILPYTLKYTEKDSKGNKKLIVENFQTGGYGHKILKGELPPTSGYTKAYWERVFEKDFEIALNGARSIIPEENLDPKAFGVLVEMVYQMGTNNVKGFKNTIKHLENKEYSKAADQLLYNFDANGDIKGWTNWHKQTPNRANEAAKLLSSL